MIPAAINSALSGMHRNLESMNRHAHRVANWNTEPTEGSELADAPVELHEEMVVILVAQRGFEANLPVLRAADEMLGTLIDILA